MEGVCSIDFRADDLVRCQKIRDYITLIRCRTPKHYSIKSELQLAYTVLAVWAIYYNCEITDDEAFADSIPYCVSEDVEIVNALILMMNITTTNLMSYGIPTDKALAFCDEFPSTKVLHCKAVSKLYGLMSEAPHMRSGLRKLHRYISRYDKETLELDIERFHMEA